MIPVNDNNCLPLLRSLTEQELEMVEAMGATGFTAGEIAEVLEVDADLFEIAFRNKQHSVHKRYRKGFLKSALELRKRVFLDAGHGSSPAQTLAKKILDDCEHKNNFNE